MNDRKTRPYPVYLLLILLAFQALSSPFNDFLIPGIILFLILGIFPLIVFYLVRKNGPLAWQGSLLVGIALLIWIGVEVAMIGYQSQPPLQLIYGTVGLLILIFTVLPSVKSYILK
ncbi:MAG: hypothetical protein P8Y60_20470 [Calditrichota bacterium]